MIQMINRIAFCCALLACPLWVAAQADHSVQITWDSDADATSYEIESSTDGGSTWSSLVTGLSSPSYTYTPSSATGVQMLRLKNCSSAGCATRGTSGVWIDRSYSEPAVKVQ